MDHEIDIFKNNPDRPRQLKGDGYDYVQDENGNWHNAINGGMVSDYDLRNAIVRDNHKHDYIALEAIMADGEAYKEKHGHYPPDHYKKISEEQKRIAASYSDVGPGYTPYIAGAIAIGYVLGFINYYSDQITSAAKSAGEMVLMAGAGAVGFAATGAVTIGAYKASNLVWEKLTGASSPIKSALTTAALFATVAGGVYYARQPMPTELAPSQPVEGMKPGFYKAANGSAYVFDRPNGPYRYVKGISADTCVRVSKGGAAGEFVRIDIIGAERALFDPGDKYAFKKELRPAPECNAP